MYELSLFLLDLVQNSITANARLVKIWLFELEKKNKITVTVADNGCGMTNKQLCAAIDPFMTTKTARKKKIGLGLPFFAQLIEDCEGEFKIKSKPGIGTVVTGCYPYDNIDQPPIGDMEQVILNLVIANPNVDFRYRRKNDKKDLIFDTRPVKKMLGNHATALWQSNEMIEWFKNQLMNN